jgi:hypothetical protein
MSMLEEPRGGGSNELDYLITSVSRAGRGVERVRGTEDRYDDCGG